MKRKYQDLPRSKLQVISKYPPHCPIFSIAYTILEELVTVAVCTFRCMSAKMATMT